MSSSDIFIGETIGTALLILLGGGVCAAVTLKASKARNAGWLAIAFGWGFAVMTAAYISGPLSGAHLNPAVTVGIAIKDGDWSNTPTYFAGQLLGAMIGAVLVWIAYYGQFQPTSPTARSSAAPARRTRRPSPSRRRRRAPARSWASSPPAPRSGTRSRTSPPRSSAPSCCCSPSSPRA